MVVLLPLDGSGILKDIALGHRKREEFWNCSAGARKSNDPCGAYTRVRVLDANTMEWKDWKDPKGYNPVKYAERRGDIEYENLHDWIHTVGNISPIAVELTSAGTDPNLSVVTEHSLDAITYPEVDGDTEIQEQIYSKGTRFIDLAGNGSKLPIYGGGKHEGHYNDAVPLGGSNGKEHFPMTETLSGDEEYLDSSGRLHIKLPAGKNPISLEIAVGDTWFNYKGPGKYQLGWAKFNADLYRDGSSQERFMDNVNVPPQGILSGGLSDNEFVAQEGDELILSSSAGTTYLMGWRVMYAPTDVVAEEIDNAGSKATSVLDEPEVVDAAAKLDLELVGHGGGTQGGKWYLNKNSGDKYFVKEYNGNLDRCATEFIANKIYKELGVAAVETQLLDGKAVTREIQNIESFDRSDRRDTEKVLEFFNHPDVAAGFVADAWMANWDVFGLDYDNVVKTPEGGYLRVDAGGALFYRGMGNDKPQFGNTEVSEIQTMRNPEMAREAGVVFHELVSDAEVKKQITQLQAVMTDEKIKEIVETSGISNSDEIIAALIGRRDWLVATYL